MDQSESLVHWICVEMQPRLRASGSVAARRRQRVRFSRTLSSWLMQTMEGSADVVLLVVGSGNRASYPSVRSLCAFK